MNYSSERIRKKGDFEKWQQKFYELHGIPIILLGNPVNLHHPVYIVHDPMLPAWSEALVMIQVRRVSYKDLWWLEADENSQDEYEGDCGKRSNI